MNIWQYSLKLMRELPPHDQVKLLLISGLFLLTLSACFTLMWREQNLSSEVSWSRVPASIISKPEIWNSDKSLYTFAIKFNTSDKKHHTAYLYAEKLYYDAANLDRNTPLLADIETTEKGAKAKRLIAPNGMILYDPLLETHITNAHNREVTLAVILFSVIGISNFIAAAAIYQCSKNNPSKPEHKSKNQKSNLY
ncbi:hypothetical protein [Pseudomonas putida]